MNFGIKFRLLALGMGVALMGALIAAITLNSQRQATELRNRLHSVDSESYDISLQFRDSLRQLNDSILHYGVDHDPAAWQACSKTSQGLRAWIDGQKPKLQAQAEKDLLQQIDVAYDNYLRATRNFHDKVQSIGQQQASLADYAPVRDASQRLFDLGHALAKAHLKSRNVLLAHAQHSIQQLRVSILALLGLLFLFGAALAFGVYRHLIAPLRVKLVESQTLAEHHEKLASLGLLAAGVAHEIRNPLTAIKAALFMQKKKFQAGSPERDSVEVVEREILRLERIVNDFLQFARPAEPELATIPADSLLLESQHFFAPQLEKNNIQLKFESSEPMHIQADAAQLKQVLINLVQNAADSIGQNGVITLRVRSDRKRLTNGETPVVILEVMDSGQGIPPEVEKRLFDPFFTTKETGTGLGLSIAARIVQKHGGELQYQTQMNHGTTFGIILPRVME
jgi:signal transduction histidine kinase